MNRRNLLKHFANIPISSLYLPLLFNNDIVDVSGFGVGMPWQTEQYIESALNTLHPSWWYDWRFENIAHDKYLPMIWSDAIWNNNQEVLISLFKRWPKKLWLLLNEPELVGQADMSPQDSIDLLNDILIYDIEYAFPGVSLSSDGYTWIEEYLSKSDILPNYWHVHIYNCRSANEWEDAWNKFKSWMVSNNVVKPVIISETNGWDGSVESQCLVMNKIVETLNSDSLLFSVAWFATRYEWNNGYPMLFDDNNALTDVGKNFIKLRGN